MPWDIKKEGNNWVVYRTDTGKIVSHHATKLKAGIALGIRRQWLEKHEGGK